MANFSSICCPNTLSFVSKKADKVVQFFCLNFLPATFISKKIGQINSICSPNFLSATFVSIK